MTARDLLGTRQARRQLHQGDALLGRHPGGRLVHQQQSRLVGERHRKLDALQVTVGQHAAGTLALVEHADLGQERVGLGDEGRAEAAEQRAQAAGVE